MMYHDSIYYLYIPISFSIFYTLNFTKCDMIFQITTQWFSESISPLSETDLYVRVHNKQHFKKFSLKMFCFLSKHYKTDFKIFCLPINGRVYNKIYH